MHMAEFSGTSFCTITMQTCLSKSPQASGDEQPPSGRVHWSKQDELILIQFLSERVSEMTDAKSFKPSVFKEAAKHLESVHDSSMKGSAKTHTSCNHKFGKVCISFHIFILYPDFYDQLKATLCLVSDLKSMLGMVYDDDRGVIITDDGMKKVWDNLVRVSHC